MKRIAALSLSLALFVSSLARAEEPLEEAIFDLRIGSGPPVTTLLFIRDDGELLLPLEDLLRLGGIALGRSEAASAVPVVDRERLAAIVPVALGFEGDRRDVLRLPRATYVARRVIEERAGVKIEIDYPGLQVIVRGDPPLPVERQLAEEERLAALRAQMRKPERAGPSLPYPAATGVGLVEWSVSSSFAAAAETSNLSLRGGAGLLGGELMAEAQLNRGAQRLTGFYSRQFPTTSAVDRVEIGDVSSPAILSRPLRGAMVTNTPRFRRSLFGTVRLAADVPPGWEYEVFRGGELIGFSQPGGSDSITVPLSYGHNPVQIQLHGPRGETVTRSVLFDIPPNAVTPGRLEYGLAAGQCLGSECDNAAYSNVRYGLTRGLTIGGGAELVNARGELTTRPYGEVVFSAGRLFGEVTALESTYSRAMLTYAGRRATAALAGGFSATGIGGALLENPEQRWYVDSSLFTRVPMFGRTEMLRFSGRADGLRGAGADSYRVGVTRQRARGHIELSYAHYREQDGVVGVSSIMLLSGRRGAALTYDVRATSQELQFVDVGLAWQRRLGSAMSVGVRWDAIRDEAEVLAGFSIQTGGARIQARGLTGTRRSDLSVHASGTIAHSAGEVARFLADPRIGSAGVEGRVFYDVDADGAFSEADRPAGEVVVIVGGLRAKSDRDGWYAVWGVPPYEVITVAVDPASHTEPGWIPRASEFRLRAVPNVVNIIEVPLIVTREVAGQVVATTGVAAVAGVGIEIIDLDTGAKLAARTFSDGEYYIPSLRPGRYRIQVAPPSLRALGAAADPVEISISGDGEPIVDAPPLVLRPHG